MKRLRMPSESQDKNNPDFQNPIESAIGNRILLAEYLHEDISKIGALIEAFGILNKHDIPIQKLVTLDAYIQTVGLTPLPIDRLMQCVAHTRYGDAMATRVVEKLYASNPKMFASEVLKHLQNLLVQDASDRVLDAMQATKRIHSDREEYLSLYELGVGWLRFGSCKYTLRSRSERRHWRVELRSIRSLYGMIGCSGLETGVGWARDLGDACTSIRFRA